MKKVIGVTLAAMALLVGSALPGHAWGGGYGGYHGYGHYGHGFGHYGHGYGHYGYGYGHYGYGYGYPYRYYSYAAPEVSPQEPTVYVQQQAYWYYCENAKAYYPHVQQCPSGWVRVAPSTAGPGQ